MQQKQDIKGFSLLELLVVVVLVMVISALGYPQFSSWQKDREVRVAAEKVSSIVSGIITQTQRGSFPYVQFSVNVTTGVNKKKFLTKGMSQKSLSSTLNAGNSLNCDIVNSGIWDNHSVHSFEAEVAVHIQTSGAVCFSKNARHFSLSGSLASNTNITLNGRSTNNYIILCDLRQLDSGGTSQIGGNGQCVYSQLQKPAYLVEWTRFGGITLYKWSGASTREWSIL